MNDIGTRRQTSKGIENFAAMKKNSKKFEKLRKNLKIFFKNRKIFSKIENANEKFLKNFSPPEFLGSKSSSKTIKTIEQKQTAYGPPSGPTQRLKVH